MLKQKMQKFPICVAAMQLDGTVKMELDELLIKPLCLACDNIDLLKSDREAKAFIWECAYACQGCMGV